MLGKITHWCLSWWRHQMETFSALLTLCEGNPTVTGGFQSQRTVARSFDVFFDLRLNKWLSKQSRRRWFKSSLWCVILWRLLKIDIISFLNENYFIIKVHGILFFGFLLSERQHGLRSRFGVKQATRHNLDQCWSISSNTYVTRDPFY